MASPPREPPSNRVLNLVDLPFEILDIIFSYITNIRERIRLMRVCVRFREAVPMHLRRAPYRLVDNREYLYQREIETGSWRRDRILNLSQLTAMAPRLTEFTVNMDNVYFDYTLIHRRAPRIEWLYLEHLRIIHLNHCRNYINRDREWIYLIGLDVTLAWAPALETLHLTIDCLIDYEFPRLEHLRTFVFNYFLENKYFGIRGGRRADAETIHRSRVSKVQISFYGIIDGSAPNLEEFRIHLKWMDPYAQLGNILDRLSINCPNLTTLSIFFEPVWQMVRRALSGIGQTRLVSIWNLPNLRLIEIRGVVFPPRSWEAIFDACPALNQCILERDTHEDVWTLALRRNITILARTSIFFYYLER